MSRAEHTKSVRIDETLHTAVRAYAYHSRITVTEIVEGAVREWLELRAPQIVQLLEADKATEATLQKTKRPTRRPERA